MAPTRHRPPAPNKGSSRQSSSRAYCAEEYPDEDYGEPWLKCMLLDVPLPAKVVCDGHIFKYKWWEEVHLWMGFENIDDPRNGFLLFKPIEWAFDHGQLCFVEKPRASGRLVCHVLDPSIKRQRLVDALAALSMHDSYRPGELSWMVILSA